MDDDNQLEIAGDVLGPLADGVIGPLVIGSIRPITRGLWSIIVRYWAKWKRSPIHSSSYSFNGPNLVPPRLVMELIGWISDRGQEIVSVDIDRIIGSNRFGFLNGYKIKTVNGRQFVEWSQWHDYGESREKEIFGYQYIATSPSGVEMLLCYESGGGSSTFNYVALLSFKDELAVTTKIVKGENGRYSREASNRKRTTLKIIGCLHLGDRYDGKIEYKRGFLTVGPDEGWYRRGEETTQRLRVK